VISTTISGLLIYDEEKTPPKLFGTLIITIYYRQLFTGEISCSEPDFGCSRSSIALVSSSLYATNDVLLKERGGRGGEERKGQWRALIYWISRAAAHFFATVSSTLE